MAPQKFITHTNAVELPTGLEKADELPPPYTATAQVLNRNSFSSSSSFSSSGSEPAVSPDVFPSFTGNDVHRIHQSTNGNEWDLQPIQHVDRKASWREWKAQKKAEKRALKAEKKAWKAERKLEKEILKRERKACC